MKSQHHFCYSLSYVVNVHMFRPARRLPAILRARMAGRIQGWLPYDLPHFFLLNLSTSSHYISKESNEFLIRHRLYNFLHYYNLEH